MARATMSVDPPGGNGTMIVTGFSGRRRTPGATRPRASAAVLNSFFMFVLQKA